MQLHKGNEGKPEPKVKGGQNSIGRKITRALKDIYDNNKDVVNNDTPNRVLSTDNLEIDTVDCESTLNLEGQGEVLPASDRETCSRGCEGLVTEAVVANSARDMSVGAVIGDHPPQRNVHQQALK